MAVIKKYELQPWKVQGCIIPRKSDSQIVGDIKKVLPI